MHLALIIDDYLPHSTRVGAKMFHDLACYYISLGHQVTVITPVENQKEKLVQCQIDSVNVWYFSSGPIKDTHKIKRAINETLLSFRAWSAISSKVKPKTFDGIIYYSPSIFFGPLVSKIKARCKCNAYLVLRDLFPQWVIDAGMIKQGSMIDKYFSFFERYSYEQADIIGLMSEKNKQIFDNKTNNIYSTVILRNWAALVPYKLASCQTSLRSRFNLEDKIIYFYGGNIGHAQDMANLMRLVKSMADYEQAHFLFVGQGDEVSLINQLAKDWHLKNFTYLPSVNQVEFKNILADIDIGLFSLSAKHTAHNFPGKLLGYMVQSIPILGSVNIGNDLLEIVNSHNAGLITVNGDDEQLLKNALLLYQDTKLRAKVGRNAFSLLESEFSVQSAGDSIIKRLKDIE
ncbi:glycosyltransferase family 4 protein [Proteus mirabilis]|uniref:glycosyltransferase family 4 protein n=1 Tax=Proteus mirabilis TaxID=584 RepID=UPI0007DC2772|nr:glycosyltransferase family 4 protein [Proteus mirabilis]MCU9564839.1 glycosyltransferase family 4 protein [Proteus mirabilis]MDM3696005.1 glycosyltransferase family 4 protein [Proteus mirabilis]OAS31817.1 glycosyltransferase WbuB [Proteus mirabilis]OAS33281.1 glycosyltransferase WbuB [Proteus mirabilis]